MKFERSLKPGQKDPVSKNLEETRKEGGSWREEQEGRNDVIIISKIQV